MSDEISKYTMYRIVSNTQQINDNIITINIIIDVTLWGLQMVADLAFPFLYINSKTMMEVDAATLYIARTEIKV